MPKSGTSEEQILCAMKTYERLRGHKSDFIVCYRLFSQSEGGRELTFQHLRCDFMYAGDKPENGIYMIHPELLNEAGQPLEDDISVPLKWRASMWIVVPEMREKVHRSRIDVGTKGYFMEGSRKIGEVVVEKIVGLHENPT